MPHTCASRLSLRWIGLSTVLITLLGMGWRTLPAQEPPPKPPEAGKPEPAAKPFERLHQLKGHTELVYALALSPNGQWLASGSFDKTVRLWDLASGQLIKTFAGPAGHQNQVLSVQFSPDQRILASSGSDNVIKFWDVPVQGALRQFAGHEAEIQAVAVSPDGARLATASSDQTVRLWNVADGKALHVCGGHVGPVLALAFSANGQMLASVGQDLMLRLWNAADGQPLAVAGAHAAPITGVAFTPNGQQAVTVSQDGWLKLWQLPLQPSRILNPPHQAPVQSLALSGDGKSLASGSTDKTVRIVNLANGNTERVITAPSEVNWIGWSQASPLLVTGHAGQKYHFWNAADGAAWGAFSPTGGPITAQAMDAKGTLFLTGDGQGHLRAWHWDVQKIQPGNPLSVPHPDAISACVLASEGKIILTGGADKIIRRWNLAANRAQPEAQFAGMEAAVTALAVRPNLQRLVSGSADGTLAVWDDKQPVILAQMGVHQQPITGIVLLPNLDEVITASQDGFLKRWSLPTPQQLFAHPQPVQQMMLNGDGSLMLTLAGDQHVRLWNLANGQIEKGYPLPTPAIKAMAFHAASNRFAWIAADKTVHVHALAEGKEEKKLDPLAYDPIALAFSPDGNTLAVAGADHPIRLITWSDGKEVRVLEGHGGPVQQLLFHPSQPRLLSQGADQQVIVWNLADGQIAAKLAHPAPLIESSLSTDGGTLATLAQDKIVRLWNPVDGQAAGQFNSPGEARGVAIAGNGQKLLLGSDGRSWLVDRGGALLQTLRHAGPAARPAFHPDGVRLLWCQQQAVAIDRQRLIWAEALGKPIRGLQWLPKSDFIVVVGDDQQVRLVQAQDGKTHKTLLGHEGPITALAVEEAGPSLVTSGADKKTIHWDLAENKPRRTWTTPQPVVQLALSPQGQRLVMSFSDHTLQVYDAASGDLMQQLESHAGPITALHLLADQRTVISASHDKLLRVHDVTAGRILAGAHPGGVTGLIFHPNGTQAFSAGADKIVKWWDVSTGQMIKAFPALPEGITAMALSREAAPTRLAVATADKIVRLFNLADGKELLQLTLPGPARSLEFNPESSQLLTAGAYPKAQVWDLTTGQELQFFPLAGEVFTARFHPDGKQVIWGGSEKTVSLAPVAIVKALRPHDAPLHDLAMLPSGTHVITAGEDGTARQINLANGQVEKTFAGHKGAVRKLSLARSAISLATAGADNTIRLFNLADGKELKAIPHPAAIHGLALSPNHAYLAVTGADQEVVVYHAPFTPGQPLTGDFGKVITRFKHDGPASGAAFLADSASLLTGSADKTVRLWKISQDAPSRNIAGHANLVDGLAFSPDGALLASCSHDGTVRLWNVADGAALASIPAFTTPVYCVTFSADGKYLLAGSYSRSMKWIDVASKAVVLEFTDLYDRAFPAGPYDGPFAGIFAKAFPQGHRDGIFSAQIAPDGKHVLSAGSDGQIKVWSLADGSVVNHFTDPGLQANNVPLPRAHQDWINQIRLTPDGARLVSVGHAGWLKVWHVADGKLLLAEKFPSGLYALVFSPDGKTIALAHQDGTISVCKMP